MAVSRVNGTMTLETVLAWSVPRTLIIATLAVWLSQGLFRRIESEINVGLRRGWLIAALIPLIVPELIIGFTYRVTAQRLTHSVAGTELLYGILILLRVTSLGVLMRWLLPESPVSRESLHTWSLLNDRRSPTWHLTRLRLLATGPWRTGLITWCLTTLVVFQDFETAALVQVDRHPVVWTVRLFDAHAGNQSLVLSLKLLLVPLLIQFALIVPAWWLVVCRTFGGDRSAPVRSAASPSATALWGSWIFIAGGVVILWPLISAVPQLRSGGTLLLNDPGALVRQQLASLGFSIAASVVALLCAVMLRRKNHPLITAVALLPGLCGSLMMSLVLLAAFQLPGMRLLWDTWLPMLLGQSLLLLPRAFLLVILLESGDSDESRHSMRLLLSGDSRLRQLGRSLLWRRVHLGWLLCGVLLVHWCGWDVTTAAILRPVSVEPVVTRLYREMHFSRTETLTVLTLITILTPLCSAAIIGMAWKMLLGLRWRNH